MVNPHPSVQALLEADGVADPVLAIRRRARSLVAEASAMGWDGPPFSMIELASLRGLKVSSSGGFNDDQDACVTPGLVLLNARKREVRQRYSIAHEVVHTLFPDYEQELRHAGQLWRREGDDSEFERLCQVGGAELLFPLAPFRTAVTQSGVSLQGVIVLAKQFDASLEATTRRLVEAATGRLLGIILRPKDRTTGEWISVAEGDGHSPRTPIGVAWAWASEDYGPVYITTGTLPPKGGAADRAWKRVSLAHGAVVIESCASESWLYAGIAGTWVSEAMTIPKGSRVPHQVLCLMQQVTA